MSGLGCGFWSGVPIYPNTLTFVQKTYFLFPRFPEAMVNKTQRDIPSSWIRHLFHPRNPGHGGHPLSWNETVVFICLYLLTLSPLCKRRNILFMHKSHFIQYTEKLSVFSRHCTWVSCGSFIRERVMLFFSCSYMGHHIGVGLPWFLFIFLSGHAMVISMFHQSHCVHERFRQYFNHSRCVSGTQ